jgi:hypothetical protein
MNAGLVQNDERAESKTEKGLGRTGLKCRGTAGRLIFYCVSYLARWNDRHHRVGRLMGASGGGTQVVIVDSVFLLRC